MARASVSRALDYGLKQVQKGNVESTLHADVSYAARRQGEREVGGASQFSVGVQGQSAGTMCGNLFLGLVRYEHLPGSQREYEGGGQRGLQVAGGSLYGQIFAFAGHRGGLDGPR
eukprot:TRINITY_DN15200_c0_g1_i2.p2 TRINITY_DN15200_c0_g1~~TRINITY_DN15200_c0_g1_i2.p2  ORF type:complete len:115 (-),score=17.65 TRINITY_DN15200_c0_g1_i2:160-504(-)